MNFDGEWRVAFIHNEHPNLQYGTADPCDKPSSTAQVPSNST